MDATWQTIGSSLEYRTGSVCCRTWAALSSRICTFRKTIPTSSEQSRIILQLVKELRDSENLDWIWGVSFVCSFTTLTFPGVSSSLLLIVESFSCLSSYLVCLPNGSMFLIVPSICSRYVCNLSYITSRADYRIVRCFLKHSKNSNVSYCFRRIFPFCSFDSSWSICRHLTRYSLLFWWLLIQFIRIPGSYSNWHSCSRLTIYDINFVWRLLIERHLIYYRPVSIFVNRVLTVL